MLTREQMLGAKLTPRTETVDASEFGEGETLTVRAMSAEEWSGLILSLEGNKDALRENVAIFTASVVDANGVRIFSDGDAGHIRSKFPASIVNRVVRAAQKLNGLRDAEKN